MTQSFQQLLVTNYGLQPSGYTGSQGVQGIAGTGGGPKISAIQVTDSSGTVLDDTAVDVAGGYVLLTGSGFESGCQVVINTTPAVSTTFVSATQVRAQVPATAAGTYIVYLVNADGGVAIRINGITFSATPVWVSGSALSGDSDAAISIQLNASGAVSYSLAAGSTLPAGLTLSSAGLLSGTVTGIELETVYNFTVNATDGELQDSPRSFAITISAGDPQIAYVTTLLSPELEVLPFNRDASTNNFAVSVLGDTRPNNFGPYTPGYYSNFFGGSGDTLSIVGNNAALGNIFTIEMWVYPIVALSNVYFYVGGGSTGPLIGYNGSTFAVARQGAWALTSSANPTVGAWNHIALVREGTGSNQYKLYLNGTLTATGTESTTFAAQSGGYIGGANAYISNLRIVNDTAVYTSAFTPPTQPLTAIANTNLLTCQSNRFIDNSTNNFTLTLNGGTRIDGFDPFVPAQEFAGRGSTYFDGTGDYLTVPNSSLFDYGSGNFTIECWVYSALLASEKAIYGKRGSAGTTSPILFGLTPVSSTNRLFIWGSTSTGNWNINGSFTPGSIIVPVNTWVHVACVRNETTITTYVNGIADTVLNSIVSSLEVNTSAVSIGAGDSSGGSSFLGYISNVRIVKGTAVYTAAFTPPTAPLTTIASTSLLTCQTNQAVNNNQFLDSSTNNFLITRNGNTTQGTSSPYGGGWSNYFDGTGDWLTLPVNAGTAPGAADFTLEAWVNLSTLKDYQVIYDNRATGASGTGFALGVDAAGKAYLYTNDGFRILSTTVISSNAWNHIALVRSGSNISLYTNGVLGGTFSSSANFSDTNTGIGIALTFTPSSQFSGYISNLRLVKGTAVYTANFTPPIAPLTAIAGTSLLTCASNRFRDASVNNFVVTRSGDVSVQKFNPFGLINASGVKTSYTPQVYGGSAYFDGTGDYLSSTVNLQSSDFTIEAWVYPRSLTLVTGSQIAIVSQYTGGPVGRWAIDIGSSLQYRFFCNGLSASVTLNGPAAKLNEWAHIVVTRVSNTFSLYVNGIFAASSSATGSLPASTVPLWVGAIDIGGSPVSFFTGQISDVRISTGTALYTSSFVPPTAPLEPVTNTTLLLNGTGAAVRDASTGNNLETVGDAKLSTTVVKYGNTSMYFDGSGDYLKTNATPIGSGDFTVEFWVYPLQRTNNSFPGLFDCRSSGSDTSGFGLYFEGGGLGALILRIGGSNNTISSSLVPIGSWTHIAVSRQSGTLKLYINGTSVVSVSNTTDYSRTVHYLGSTFDVYTANVYMNDFRVTKGVGRYTANFTPPAGAFKTK
jgi:hypothetical protein